MNNDHKIRVLIVEDHTMVRLGLRRLLEDVPDMQVVGDVERGEEAIRIVEEQPPDVVLLSAYSDESLVFPALRNGAIGYMLKNALPEEVIEAVRDAVRGWYHIHASVLERVFKYVPDDGEPDNPCPSSLTSREKELAKLIIKGMTNAEIAKKLNISPATVKTHVSNILRKLDAPDRNKVAIILAHQDPGVLS
jgi:NarL family two-component system response regulator LiaR